MNKNLFNIEIFNNFLSLFNNIKDKKWDTIETISDIVNMPEQIKNECESKHHLHFPNLDWYKQLKDIEVLVTFGCSWTYGVGANYKEGMEEEEYMKTAWNEDLIFPNSFRGILSKKLNLLNINFSQGGASNQKNIRKANVFLCSPLFQDICKKAKRVIILWGITSTARNELWNNERDGYDNFMYNDVTNKAKNTRFNQAFVKNTYNHEVELLKLSQLMVIYDIVFNALGMDIIWFNTFNDHIYKYNIKNLLKEDLLTYLSNQSNKNNFYHLSIWEIDDIRLNTLIQCNDINPISFHPTKQGHQKIADMLEVYIKNKSLHN